MSVVIAN